MNLAHALREAGIEWAIDRVFIREEGQCHPGRFYKVQHMRVRLADWGSLGDGASTVAKPQTLEKTLRYTEQEVTVERLLAIAMAHLMPKHPVRLAFLKSVGNTPVRVPADTLKDDLGPTIHVQLRKCIDSKQSVIQWNAIHHLLPADWTHILQNIRQQVMALRNDVATKQKAGLCVNLLRRDVGLMIKHAMTAGMEQVTYRGYKGEKIPERTELQKFALQSFEAANWLTEDSEWIHGWTSHLCEDAAPFVPKLKTNPKTKPTAKTAAVSQSKASKTYPPPTKTKQSKKAKKAKP